MNKRILQNKAQCLICGQVIESTHVHDYVTCSCGNLSVDGGNYYLKRSIKKMNEWKDTSVFYEETLEEKSLRIINYNKPIPQAKKLVEEAFELAESILNYEHGVEPLYKVIGEVSDVSLMINEFKEYYKITKEQEEKVMNYKADRTLNKIEQIGGEVNMEKEKLELKLKHLEEEQFLIDLSDKWTEYESNRYSEITKEILEIKHKLHSLNEGEQND